MSSVCKALGIVLAICAGFASTPAAPSPLRVCADPNNMPFSNERGEGFDNKIATLVARELGRPLRYFWLPQRRGFIRNSLNAQRCVVVAAIWGPLAGYYAQRESTPIDVTSIVAALHDPSSRFTFD